MPPLRNNRRALADIGVVMLIMESTSISPRPVLVSDSESAATGFVRRLIPCFPYHYIEVFKRPPITSTS